jgi:hypothetical protein
MATGKSSGQELGNRSEIDPKNAIGVRMEDLPKEDQRWIMEEMRCELEEVEAANLFFSNFSKNSGTGLPYVCFTFSLLFY